MIFLDIETKAIEFGKPLLPEPVGVALITEVGEHLYYAFGHPIGNNIPLEKMKFMLACYWASDHEICTHNGASFDIPILQHYFDLPTIDPLRVHDTLFLAYLHNPHARSLSLKDLANDWCGMPPDEQETLYDWIMANTDCKSRKKAGAYISQAPAQLVGPYAIGDVVRTKRLFEYLYPSVSGSMGDAYARELRLAPILADVQARGVRVSGSLHNDTHFARQHLNELDHQVREVLNAPNLSVDSNNELIQALSEKGYSNFLLTPTGKPSAGKESLAQALRDAPEVQALLKRRSTFATMVGTFMEPWCLIATENNGRIHASYNQVRNPDGYGTRTGRLSSSNPNFQNVPKDMGEEYPNMRSYLLPEEGYVWVTADFKNQEPRIAAHFEDGALMRAFKDNPQLDPYLFVAETCGTTRKQAKVILLGLLYAMGAQTLADSLDVPLDEASRLRTIIKATMPDITALEVDCKRRFQKGLPIRTLGGRLYHCEPPSNGRQWDYKALNTLIQGSASDQTKEAIIYIHSKLIEGERILGTVHDEISVSCYIDRIGAIEAIMQEAANVLPIDVPMLMDFGHGDNWSEAK